MDIEEVEAIIETCLEAVHEQYVLPLTLALRTLTIAVCSNPEIAPVVAEALRKNADSCPSDVAGRILLQVLAKSAAGPDGVGPDDVQDAVRKSLRLIRGGKPDQGIV